ncbi:2-phosphosulfolactate phosphatase [Planococcus sp. ISL-109]|uniref:2-phosphosulfolactate phosphatase n=1 Tax=Planococcus sp. ISL-109 TaxID=2819166 RepID=UPI001BEA2E35|nr:2-phosphosulfolactate phosphatase [Planococcus sp. ISL-109]MBT2582664.1 2-phosphosulfolactate phosphatase [Planococcus sp. ISL-109]
MRKIHVITQKEAVREERLAGCTAAVIDVFLATSTIIFLLDRNYEPVHAVRGREQALELSRLQQAEHLLLGESKGEGLAGFDYPDPALLEHSVERRAAIICSTNGTIAIEKAKNAKKLYISSLVNGHRVAERIHQEQGGSSIVLVCSGNDDRFSMEDFIGAGQLVEHLTKWGNYELSDAAKLAQKAYRSSLAEGFKELLGSETADLLKRFNFPDAAEFVIRQHEQLDVVPIYVDGMIVRERGQVKSTTE